MNKKQIQEWIRQKITKAKEIWAKTPVIIKHAIEMTWLGWLMTCFVIVASAIIVGVTRIYEGTGTLAADIFIIAIFTTLMVGLLKAMAKYLCKPY